MIKTAIIGYGASGVFFHATILKGQPEFEITAVVSSRPDDVHADLPNARVYATTEELLTQSDVELCIVATVNAQHGPLTRQCLEAGRHVLVEKPFVLEPEEGDALGKLAKDKGLVLAVYHNRRFDSDFRTLKELIASGRLGKPHTLFSHFDRFAPKVRDRWREWDEPGAGVLWDLGSHLIDQALTLLGPVRSVLAQTQIMRDGAKAVDHFHLVLEHGTATSILHADCLTVAPGPRFMLHGTKGSFVKYGMDQQEASLRQKIGPTAENLASWGLEPEEIHGTLTEFQDDGTVATSRLPSLAGHYQDFYKALAAAIRTGSPAPATAEQATTVIRIIKAAEASAAQGRRIDVDESGRF